MDIDRKNLTSVHFVGIKGVAMTALALYCKEKGLQVTGSDVAEDFPTKESLDEMGIVPMQGFAAEHIDGLKAVDLVVYTGAHGGCDNPEVERAKEKGIEVMPHGRALGFFMEGSVQVSIAGSHGKTTTTAMIATILTLAGKDPSYAIGCGQIRGLGKPGHYGKGKEFIAEADEYVTDPTHDPSPRFLWQQPHVLAVTNIDYDHPDAYKTIDQMKNAFIALQDQQEGIATTVVNLDDPNSKLLLEGRTIVTFGKKQNADMQISTVEFAKEKTLFKAVFRGELIGPFVLRVPGVHNVFNAAAALCVCRVLGLSWEDGKKGLATFGGTKRRFEHVGTAGTVDIYDDYAHHPSEIEATLEGVRQWYPNRRIITIFQPHTYSRTRALLPLFASCFRKSDIVCIADIYMSARETKADDVTSAALVKEISRHQEHVYEIVDLPAAIAYVKDHVLAGDLILCMGAGDIYGWGQAILQIVKEKFA